MREEVLKMHAVKHIWMAYAKKLMAEHPEYKKKGTKNMKDYDFIIYKIENFVKVEVTSYTRFRKIIEHYFDRAKIAIINGQALHINQCGKICARRIERDFRKKKGKVINWHKTKQQPLVPNAEGGLSYAKKIYFTDDDYCRVAWFKPNDNGIPNASVYEFTPTGNDVDKAGFSGEFSTALKEDKLLKYRYLFAPIKDPVDYEALKQYRK